MGARGIGIIATRRNAPPRHATSVTHGVGGVVRQHGRAIPSLLGRSYLGPLTRGTDLRLEIRRVSSGPSASFSERRWVHPGLSPSFTLRLSGGVRHVVRGTRVELQLYSTLSLRLQGWVAHRVSFWSGNACTALARCTRLALSMDLKDPERSACEVRGIPSPCQAHREVSRTSFAAR